MEPITPQQPQQPVQPGQPIQPQQPMQNVITPTGQPQIPTMQPTPQNTFTPPASTFPGPSAFPMTSPKGSSNKKIILIAVAAVAVLAIIGVVVMTMGKKDSDTKSSTPAPAASTSTTPLAQEETKAATPAAEPQEIAVGKSIKSDVGVTVTIEKIKRNVPSTLVSAGKEMVLVYVSETSDGKYSSSAASISTYRLLDAAGTVYNEDSFNLGRKELTAAGYPLIFDAVKSGNDLGKGWLAFQVPAGQKSLSLRYVQKETKVLNGGTIAAKNFDTPLVQ